MVKRSASSSPAPSSSPSPDLSSAQNQTPPSIKTEPQPSPSTPSRKGKTISTSSPTKRAKQNQGAGEAIGEFTPDSREGVIEDLIAAGLKTTPLETLATKYDLSRLQIRNATQKGRKGNLRDKAAKAVRGD